MIELHPVTESDASSSPGTPTGTLRSGRSGRARSPAHATASRGKAEADGERLHSRTHGAASGPTNSASLAPASLPCCVRPLIQFLVYDCMRDGDELDTVLRKAAIAISALLGVVGVCYAVGTMLRVGATGGAIALMCSTLSTATGVALYLYVRRTAEVPEPAFLLWFAQLTAIVALFVVVNPTGAPANYCILLAFGMVMCKLPRLMIWLLALTAIVGVASYNEALIISHATAQHLTASHEFLVLPGHLQHSVVSLVMERVLTFCVALLLLCGVRSLLDGHVLQSRVTRDSATLAAAVAAELALYRTSAAGQLLRHAGTVTTEMGGSAHPLPGATDAPSGRRASFGADDLSSFPHADGRLVEVLRAIVGNIDALKPHLPNWFLGGAGDDGGDAPLASARTIPYFVGTTTGGSVTSAPESGRHGARSAKRATSSVGRKNLSPSFHVETGRHHGTEGIADAANHKVSSQRSFRVAVSSRGGQDPQRAAAGTSKRAGAGVLPWLPRHTSESRAFAEVRVQLRVDADRFAGRDLATVNHAVVDAVFAAAERTSAAVMAITGDAVDVTWNATTAVDVPGAGAGQFLGTLRDDVTAVVVPRALLLARAPRRAEYDSSDTVPVSRAPVVVSAAGVVGRCHVHLAGKAARHRAVVVHSDARPLMAKLLQCASGHPTSVFLGDSGCVEAAGTAIQARGVMAVTVPLGTGGGGGGSETARPQAAAGAAVSVAVGHGVIATLPASATFVETAPTHARVARVFEVVGHSFAGPSSRVPPLPPSAGASAAEDGNEDGAVDDGTWPSDEAAAPADSALAELAPALRDAPHHANVSMALQLCLRGLFADAVADLESLPVTYVAGAPMVEQLLARARRFAAAAQETPDAAGSAAEDFALPLDA